MFDTQRMYASAQNGFSGGNFSRDIVDQKNVKKIVTLDDCSVFMGQDIGTNYGMLFSERGGYEYFSRLLILDCSLDSNNKDEAAAFHENISSLESFNPSSFEVNDREHNLDYREVLNSNFLADDLGGYDLLRWLRAMGPTCSQMFVEELKRRGHSKAGLVSDLHLKWLSIYRKGIIAASKNGYDSLIGKLLDFSDINYMMDHFTKMIEEVKLYPVTNAQDEEELDKMIRELQQGLGLLNRLSGYPLQEEISFGVVDEQNHLGLGF